MNQINLNTKNPVKEFTLNAADSHLLIQSIHLTSKNDKGDQWTDFISKIQLIAELKYVVFDVSEDKFIDERKEQFPIYLLIDHFDDRPVFHVNKLIKNESFTLGIDPERKFYNILKLAVQNTEHFDDDYNLEFNVEKFK
ncbi:MAG: hypothetical protein ACOYLP_09695, partial [Flavobacterium sp.]|uniref:hypothetical protein n=1 Tax=Flavobacterium sp. TaxID=239 RepID=UPI003BE780F6